MSQLFISSDADALADELLTQLAVDPGSVDPFQPTTIVVPNRFVQQWLHLRIARARGVAINIRFVYLEQAIWDWLREIDPREHDHPPELLDDERYSLMALSILWNDDDPDLRAIASYWNREASTGSRIACRRAWQMAQLFGRLIRDYEYHRQDEIIQAWLKGASIASLPDDWRERESAQRAVFRRVVAEIGGRRAELNRSLARNFKTLPQYVMEFIYEVEGIPSAASRVIHLFGLSSISPLHMRALELLGRFHDWRIYHQNPLAERLVASPTRANIRELADVVRRGSRSDPSANSPSELAWAWGRAAGESLEWTADFLRDPAVRSHVVPSRSATGNTVLGRLRQSILGDTHHARIPPDGSLQIVRCPGIWREAETIHAVILGMLDRDRSLQQTDIAVLVTDIDEYRPVFTAVFERPPRKLSYGIADYSAARVSMYGQALVGMLDLALENLSRTRVFEVLLNPCVLARLGVSRDAALHWLTWAENLGIRHGWDAAEKREQGYTPSPLYSWKLGLQKLRLGRYMNVASEESVGSTPQWRGVIPFGDVESGDRDRLDAFCRVVEGLLPMLVRLRHRSATGAEWHDAIVALMRGYLAVPDDRAEEEPVRDALIESLTRFREWDVLSTSGQPTPVPLAMVREFLVGHLQGISGRRHDVLSSGVTIAALKPQRPVPFRVVFLAGMDEALFPGGASASPFDLRQIHRLPGDILPVEQQRLAFLEAILAARETLVITSNCRDIQNDADRPLAIPVVQLQRFVAAEILDPPEFPVVSVPLLAHDVTYLDPPPECRDILVQERPIDRALSIDRAVATGRVTLTADQREALHRLRRLESAAAIPMTETSPRHATVTLAWMRKFLENPAAAAVRFHLNITDEWDDDLDEDHEPLASGKWIGNRLVEQSLRRFVQRAETEPLELLGTSWVADFEAKYREGSLRGRLPEGPFAEVDAGVLREAIATGLDGGGLIEFLRRQVGRSWSGPMLVGESLTPLGAKRHLPALSLTLTRHLPAIADLLVRIVGHWPFVWEDDAAIDLLVFQPDPSDTKGALDRRLFEPLLFVLALAALGELRDRQVTLHLVRDEIEPLTLRGPLLSVEGAKEYLAELATDCLDPACADMLPFKILRGGDFRDVYQGEHDLELAAQLVESWREKEEDRDWAYKDTVLSGLTDIGFRVPNDAYEKMRKRFLPLHRLVPETEPKPRAKAPARRKKGDKA